MRNSNFINIFRKVWNDPVWSKVISGIILLILPSVYAFIKSCIDDVSFYDTLTDLMCTDVRLWIILLILIALCIGSWTFAQYRRSKVFVYDNHSYENDKNLYENHLKDLSPDGSIYFLRTNNFAGFSFHLSDLDELKKFSSKYTDDPRIEFFHPDLERLRQKLMTDIDQFEDLICVNTFPGSRDDLQTVPPEWEEENPNRFWEVVNAIHTAARQVCADYDEFVKLGKRVIRM